MKSNARSSGLRRVVFAGVLAATGAAAVLSPDWSSVLKAQGYYGSVDLSIDAVTPAQLLPGQEFVVNVAVRNMGPDIAHRVRTIARAPQLVYYGGDGCNGPSFPNCALSDGMEPSILGYTIVMRVPADARNHVVFSASVASDDVEANPGDEIVVTKIPIYVPVDLRTDIACARDAAPAREMVRCSIRFSNPSQYHARLPLLRASVDATLPAHWSCESSQAGQCATAAANGNRYEASPGTLTSGSSVTFFVDLPAGSAQPIVRLDAEARLNPAMGETDLAPANNQAHLDYEPSIFADDFEPAN
jgi:hypothetical protein